MYLNFNQLQSILTNNYFTQPVTTSQTSYVYYRRRMNVIVHTMRFNLTPTFTENFMIQTVIGYLMHHFTLNTSILASIQYDLLLSHQNNEDSYYIWRANSNSSRINTSEDTMFSLTYNNVFRFVQSAHQVDIPTLNIHFETSNVVIDRALAIVFSFVIL